MTNKNTCPSVDMNFLSPNGFILVIERLPLVTFFSQSVQLPTISLSSIDQETPFSKIKIPGDILDFQQLTVPFIVDENMNNYMEAFNWIRGLAFPENYGQYKKEITNREFANSSELSKNYSDAKLLIMNSHNNVIRTISFVDCFPVSLQGIQFDTKATDVTYASSSITFDYSYFSME